MLLFLLFFAFFIFSGFTSTSTHTRLSEITSMIISQWRWWFLFLSHYSRVLWVRISFSIYIYIFRIWENKMEMAAVFLFFHFSSTNDDFPTQNVNDYGGEESNFFSLLLTIHRHARHNIREKSQLFDTQWIVSIRNNDDDGWNTEWRTQDRWWW